MRGGWTSEAVEMQGECITGWGTWRPNHVSQGSLPWTGHHVGLSLTISSSYFQVCEPGSFSSPISPVVHYELLGTYFKRTSHLFSDWCIPQAPAAYRRLPWGQSHGSRCKLHMTDQMCDPFCWNIFDLIYGFFFSNIYFLFLEYQINVWLPSQDVIW